MANSDFKQHIATEERTRWEKVVVDFGNHLGSGGISNHRLGNGTIPGFSTNDFSNVQRDKLTGIQDGALNNPHPATHPYTMITGLSVVGHSGRYPDLLEIPATFPAGGGNSDTVGGIRITQGPAAPADPKNNQEIWIDTTSMITKIYVDNIWVGLCAVWP